MTTKDNHACKVGLYQHICFVRALMFVFAFVCCSSFAFGQHAPTPNKLDTSELKDLESHWRQVNKLYSDLESRLNEAKLKSDLDQEALEQMIALVEQFAMPYSELFELDKNLSLLNSSNNQKNSNQTAPSLKQLNKELQRIEKTFLLIEQSIQADLRAAQTRKDSKMYYMMRMKTKVPTKAQRAYGLMEVARQKRDLGQFEEALLLWEQTEDMIEESFAEHIENMAKWRENNKRNVEKKRERVKLLVEDYLDEYFVKIPGGKFHMGDDKGAPSEKPRHEVEIKPFYLGKTEVTFELYDLCVKYRGCYSTPADMSWGREDRPVINVSYKDISTRFLPWLNKLTGKSYRLPSESEWEYAARAGSETNYSWGNNLLCSQARFDGGPGSICNTREEENQGTYPVQSFQANPFGLYDMHGNVWEWVEDCWTVNYDNAPNNNQVQKVGNCNARVLRGGAWDSNKQLLRSASRFYFAKSARRHKFGFRLARDAE